MFVVFDLFSMAVVVIQIMAVKVIVAVVVVNAMVVVVAMRLLFHAFHNLLLNGIHVIHPRHDGHVGGIDRR